MVKRTTVKVVIRDPSKEYEKALKVFRSFRTTETPKEDRIKVYKHLGLSKPPKTNQDIQQLETRFKELFLGASDTQKEAFFQEGSWYQRVLRLESGIVEDILRDSTLEPSRKGIFTAPRPSVYVAGAAPASEKVVVDHILKALGVTFSVSDVAPPKATSEVVASLAWDEIQDLVNKGIKQNEEVEISFGTFSYASGQLKFSPGVSAQTFAAIKEAYAPFEEQRDIVEIDANSSYRRISRDGEYHYEDKLRYRERTLNVVGSSYRVSFSKEVEGTDENVKENFKTSLIRRRTRWTKKIGKHTLDLTRVVQEDLKSRAKLVQHEVEIEFGATLKHLPEFVGAIQTIILGGGLPFSLKEREAAIAEYEGYVASSGGRGISTAWMSKPTNLTIPELSRKWAVTNKLDGQRRTLIVTHQGVWVHTDPDFLKIVARSPPGLTAVIDCEYYQDTYYAFDCVWYNYKISGERLKVRLSKVESVVRALKNLIRIEMKTFYHPEDAEMAEETGNPVYECVRRAFREQESTGSDYDGIIFQSTGPYDTRSARKWKPKELLSIDFYLDLEDQGTYTIHTWNKARQINLPWEGKWFEGKEVSSTITYASGMSGTVVECVLQDGEWVVMRERPDKLYPNATHVAESTWGLITRPIEKTTIEGKDLVMMRTYHNKIKAGLINSTIRGKTPDVIDFGSGQGGDIDKWIAAGLSHVWCIEPSESMREMFEERMKKKKKSIPRLEREAVRLLGRSVPKAIATKIEKLEKVLSDAKAEISRLSKSDPVREIELRTMLANYEVTDQTPASLKTLMQRRELISAELTKLEMRSTQETKIYGSKYYDQKTDPDSLRAAELKTTAKNLKDLTYDLVPMGADDPELLKVIGTESKGSRVVFSFFSMTFMAPEKKMDALVENIDLLLRVPGAMFVGLVLDGNKIRENVPKQGLLTDAYSIVPTGKVTKSSYNLQTFNEDGSYRGDVKKSYKYPQIVTNINEASSKVKDVTEWAFCFEAFADKMIAKRFKLKKTGFLDSGRDFEALGADARLWSSMTRYFIFERHSYRAPLEGVTYPTGAEYRVYDGVVLVDTIENLYVAPGLPSFFAAYLYATEKGYHLLGPEEQKTKANALRKKIADGLDPTLIGTLVDPKRDYQNLNLPLEPQHVVEYVSNLYGFSTVVLSKNVRDASIYGFSSNKVMVISYHDQKYYPFVLFEDEDTPIALFTEDSPGFKPTLDALAS